jgi:hypothetical protein
MLHPETTEDSVLNLLSNALGITQEEFTGVKLFPRNMPTPTFISFKGGLPEDFFEKSLDSAVWPNEVAIWEFVSRPSVARIFCEHEY